MSSIVFINDRFLGCEYFSVPVTLDSSGAAQAHDIIDSATPFEKKLLEAAYSGLKGNIENGVHFIKNPPPK